MNKKIRGTLMFLLLAASFTITAQNVYIKTINGDRVIQQISDIDKGSFEGINLVFDMTDNTTKTYNLLGVKKMYFYDSTVNSNEIQEKNDLLVYPNPSTGKFQILNNDGNNKTVCIYSLQGNLIFEKTISGNNCSFDLSGFSSGVYIIKTDNFTQKLVLQ